MNFNSFTYILLLLSVVLLHGWLRGVRAQNLLLLLASYSFYATWDWRVLGLLLLSTLVNYAAGHAMQPSAPEGRRRRVLAAALLFNLGLLGFFKYFNFFVESFAGLFNTLGLPASSTTLTIILPVGISFYTFQLLSYVIDVYRGDSAAASSPLNFGLYVAFFPQILAGPIERAATMLPQYAQRRTPSGQQVETGLMLILLGLFKKLVLADVAASLIAADLFAAPLNYPAGEVLVAVYLFALQLYADFAGYSDIARGSARLLGIELMANFRQPYFAQTITDFWNRWHISLSLWFRVYVFLPFSRRLLKRTNNGDLSFMTAIMVTMLLSGLWHGAAWTFVLWGGLHGAYQAVGRPLRNTARPLLRHKSPVVRRIVILGRVALTFHLVLLAWVLFRTTSLPLAGDVYAQMASAYIGNFGADVTALALSAALLWGMLLLLDWMQEQSAEIVFAYRLPLLARTAVYIVMLVSLMFFAVKPYVPFIYFQF